MFFPARVAAIEILEHEVRVAVVKAGGKLPAVLELLRAPIECDNPEALSEARAAALDTALSQMKSVPSSYVLCADSSHCIARMLSIPFKGARRVAAAVKFELEPYLAFPIEELAVDYNIVAVLEGETEVLAMGIRQDYIEERLRALETAGIEAELVTLDAVGLTALWQSARKKTKGLQAVLHARRDASCLVILHNNTLAFFRHIPHGIESIKTQPGPVAREVQNTLRAFMAKWRGGGEISQLAVTGIPFTFEQREAFANAARLSLEDIVLVSQCKGGSAALNAGPEDAAANTWDACIGAAHMAAGAAPYAIDFNRETESSLTTLARGIAPHLMFSACLALFGLVGWAFYYYQGAAQNRAEIAVIEAKTAELEEKIAEFQSQGLPADIDVSIFNDPTLLDLLLEISRKMPGNKVTLTQIKVNPPGARSCWIQIEGAAPEAGPFNEVFAQLKTSTLFDVHPEPDLSASGSKVSFKVKIFRKGESTDEDQA